MADIIQQRRDTAARWAQYNPILMEGEVGYVTDNPNQYKIGNGRDRWNNLPSRGYTGTITQDTGDDENAVMSQKATTEKLSELGSKEGEVHPIVFCNKRVESEAGATSKVLWFDDSINQEHSIVFSYTGNNTINKLRFYSDTNFSQLADDIVVDSDRSYFFLPKGAKGFSFFFDAIGETTILNVKMIADNLESLSNVGVRLSNRNAYSIEQIRTDMGDILGATLVSAKTNGVLESNVFKLNEVTNEESTIYLNVKQGNIPNALRFYKDANYVSLAEFKVDYNGQAFLLPQGAYSVNLIFDVPDQTSVFEFSITCNNVAAKVQYNKQGVRQNAKEIEGIKEREQENKKLRLKYYKKDFSPLAEHIIPVDDLQYGYITSNGDYAVHNKRIVTNYTYIGSNNAVNVIATGAWTGQSIDKYVYIYQMQPDGTMFFKRALGGKQNWSASQNQVAYLASDETHIRVYFQFQDASWNATKIALEDLSQYIKLYYRPYKYSDAITAPFEVLPKLELRNNNVGWMFGQAEFITNKLSYTTSTPIKVKSGTKYLINAKSKGNLDKVQFFTSVDGKEWKSGGWIPYNSGSPAYNVIYQIPKGHSLLRITINLYNEINDFADLDSYDVTLWNTELDKVCYSSMIIPLTKDGNHYAQGMDINNGYVFQSFATGEIEIYRLSDRKYIQTVEMPLMGGQVRHLGMLKFSNEKVAEDDDFNIMWIPSEAIGYKDIAVRWLLNDGVFSYEIVKELADMPNRMATEERTERSKFGYDIVGGRYISMSYNINEYKGQYGISDGYPTIEVYSVSSWDENAEYTLQKSINLNEGYALQMAFLQKDKMYIPVGTGLNAMTLWVVDLFNEELSQIIDLTQFGIDVEEPQNLTIYNGQVYLSTVHGIYIINL